MAANAAMAQTPNCPNAHQTPCTKKSPEYYEALAEMRMARLQARQLQQDTAQTAASHPQRTSNNQNQSKPSVPEEVILPRGRWIHLVD